MGAVWDGASLVEVAVQLLALACGLLFAAFFIGIVWRCVADLRSSWRVAAEQTATLAARSAASGAAQAAISPAPEDPAAGP